MRRISREKALERGLTRYFTGKPCKNGHISPRLAKSWSCCQCTRENVLRGYHALSPKAKRALLDRKKVDRLKNGHRWPSQTKEARREYVRRRWKRIQIALLALKQLQEMNNATRHR